MSSQSSNLADTVEAKTAQAQVEADERVKLLKKENKSLKNKLNAYAGGTAIIQETCQEILADKNFLLEFPQDQKPKAKKSLHSVTPILVIGDVHMGYYSEGDDEYSVDTARERVNQAVDKFLAIVRDMRASANLQECRLYFIGDMVEGEMMRGSQPHHIEANVFEQAIREAPKLLSEVTLRLLAHFERIKIVAVPGNHGRNGPPKTSAHEATNWDSVCYEVTKSIVEGALGQHFPKRKGLIEWDLPAGRKDAWIAFDYVEGWCHAIIHGEQMKGKGWGGIPFYGVERIVRRYSDISKHCVDHLFMGHIHRHAVIPSNYQIAMVNGAVQSSTTYAKKELASASPPCQSAVFIDKKHGWLSCHPLWLGERLPTSQRKVRG